jgi:hypothetical protein
MASRNAGIRGAGTVWGWTVAGPLLMVLGVVLMQRHSCFELWDVMKEGQPRHNYRIILHSYTVSVNRCPTRRANDAFSFNGREDVVENV